MKTMKYRSGRGIRTLLVLTLAFVISLSTGMTVNAATPSIVDGSKYDYSTTGTGDVVMFQVGSGSDKYEGTCMQMGAIPASTGRAKAGTVDNSSKLAKIAWKYGVDKNWQGNTGDASSTFGLPDDVLTKRQALMLMHQATNQGYSTWKNICVSEGYASETVADAVISYLRDINYSSISVPSNFEIHTLDCGDDQDGVVWRISPNGFLTVNKTAVRPNYNNPNATLAGAVYYVYTNQACTTRAKDATGDDIALTTDASGNTAVVEVATGTYYVKEVTASPGYSLDTNVYTLKVTSSNTQSSPKTASSAEPKPTGYAKVKKQSGNTDITG